MPLKKITIMIIDDDSDDRHFFVEAVKEINLDFQCIEAEHGEDAIKQLNNATRLPHYIFLDLNMPVIDGEKCLKALKADDRFKKTPVIIYSTSISNRSITELRKLFASDFIHKPTDIFRLPEEIISSIKTADSIIHQNRNKIRDQNLNFR